MPSRSLPQSQEIYFFLKKLTYLNLTSTIHGLMSDSDGYEWTHDRATQAVTHYMMFLLLIQCYPDIQLTPNWEIDRVWHHHILSNTYQYEKDCQMLFGCMIHRISDREYYEGYQNKRNEKTFETTIILFEKHFGVVLNLID